MSPGEKATILAQVESHCRVTPLEARLLEAPEAPIVLLVRRGPVQ
jgi:hydrogenase maturation factor HypF (carbamoyltransferase family)